MEGTASYAGGCVGGRRRLRQSVLAMLGMRVVWWKPYQREQWCGILCEEKWMGSALGWTLV